MIAATLLLTVAISPASADPVPVPADALGLADQRTQGPVSAAPPTSPRSTGRRHLPAVGGLGTGVAVAALAAAAARRTRRRDDDPVFVLVHGDGGSSGHFDRLVDMMGLDADDVVSFDYRSVTDGSTSTSASRHARAPDAAVELDRLIRELATAHGSVYSIHHSKGGAVGVEMIADLDAGRRPPIDGYRGAALLDPAIASGALGFLQRLGGPITQIPDNGDFDPIRCTPRGCRDVRKHLGDAAGVEVIAIRNPDAVVTNFTGEPTGLRVYDLVDDGKPSAWNHWWNPFAFVRRTAEAHGSVLSHPAVADCIAAEADDPGSCDWRGDVRSRRVVWGRGGGVNRVL